MRFYRPVSALHEWRISRGVFMKRVINAAFFFLLIIVLFACVGVTIDSFGENDFGEAFVGIAFTLISLAGVRKTYRNAFGDHDTAPTPQQNQQQMFNPEMDHVDDMSMQYNPYFSDVYAEQAQEKQQQLQQQLEQQQLLQQQMMQQNLLRQQMLEQQLLQQQLVQQQMSQQQMLQQQLVQQDIDNQLLLQQQQIIQDAQNNTTFPPNGGMPGT